ncbi:DUF1549 and DUF1553 domain-containing protein [Prosthecobacter fluviatilis]|uniref:DUF1549 and DUF1553 domain-containing protein n=1 Tax=Prosthecobacter fluviatilis TaxID=445931 RepID=A0ABW0KR84_9BACT
MNCSIPSLVGACITLALSSAVSAAEAVSFRNDVMAAISKAGCNLGTCHGNATGKGGFKLSLRGQDPDFDFKALARDVSGRRVNLFAPERSLLLVKGSNQIAHEGGRKLDPKTWEYQVLRDWIAAGMPRADSDAPEVIKLTVTPSELVLDEPQDRVQIKVQASFANGSQRDVTERSIYEPLQNGLVEVSRSGLVRRLQFGEPGVLVRYLNHSVPVRLTFVKASPAFTWSHPLPGNYIDSHIFSKLRTLRMNPSALCSDEVFIRRAWLDLCGMIPPADEARAFEADTHRDKRARLIDRLMVRPEFADYWTLKWSDVLKVESRTLDTKGLRAFHGWIRSCIASNRPVNDMVRAMLASRGSTYHEPETNFYRANRTPELRATTAAQVFLGTRLQCAQCHNHPFDRWTQDDYYNWSAVFARVDYKILEDIKPRDKSDKHEFNGEQVVFLNAKLNLQNPRTGEKAQARFLGADMPRLAEKEDELQAAANWLTSPQHPLFAKAQANRIWYHLMGHGLVDPVDDMRLTNPASHPQLLEELAQDLVRSGFDLRHLIRTIMLSRTYQLDSTPTQTNAADLLNYSHHLPRRLSAEQLLDSLYSALRVTPDFNGWERGTRASQIPGPANGRGGPAPMSPEAFLAQFGRPKRELSCECERTADTSIGQIFQFVSGPVVSNAVSQKYNRLHSLAKNADNGAVIRDLYWAVLTRAPNADESKVMEALLASAKDRRLALEDIAWSLVNAKEFLLCK